MQQIQNENDMDKLEVILKRIAIVVFENLVAQQLFKVYFCCLYRLIIFVILNSDSVLFRRKMMYTAGIET